MNSTSKRYVRWPKSTIGQTNRWFVIGILGEDQFSGTLDQIAATRTVNERKITVRRFGNLKAYRPTSVLPYDRCAVGDADGLHASSENGFVVRKGERTTQT